VDDKVDAKASWRETVENSPEFAIHSLRQISEAAEKVSNSISNNINAAANSATIFELNDDVPVLSAQSLEYSKYIPSFAPQLKFNFK
jgi:hypothetical protein